MATSQEPIRYPLGPKEKAVLVQYFYGNSGPREATSRTLKTPNYSEDPGATKASGILNSLVATETLYRDIRELLVIINPNHQSNAVFLDNPRDIPKPHRTVWNRVSNNVMGLIVEGYLSVSGLTNGRMSLHQGDISAEIRKRGRSLKASSGSFSMPGSDSEERKFGIPNLVLINSDGKVTEMIDVYPSFYFSDSQIEAVSQRVKSLKALTEDPGKEPFSRALRKIIQAEGKDLSIQLDSSISINAIILKACPPEILKHLQGIYDSAESLHFNYVRTTIQTTLEIIADDFSLTDKQGNDRDWRSYYPQPIKKAPSQPQLFLEQPIRV